MGEKMPSIIDIAAFIIRVLIAFLTIMILITLFVNVRPIIETKSLIKSNAEIMENVFSSTITANRAIFDSKELDKLDNSDLETPVRHCSTGYFLHVRTKDDEWSFGYKPIIFTEGTSISQEYPAAVFKNEILPARVSLTVHDTILTRVSCMIEKAYKLGEVQSLEIPCLFLSARGGKEPPQSVLDCVFSVYKKQESNKQFICADSKQKRLFSLLEIECRYLPDVDFADAFLTYSRIDSGKATLKAFPVKAEKNCDTLKKNPGLTAKRGEVGLVILCVE